VYLLQELTLTGAANFSAAVKSNFLNLSKGGKMNKCRKKMMRIGVLSWFFSSLCLQVSFAAEKSDNAAVPVFFAAVGQDKPAKYKPGELIVKFKKDGLPEQQAKVHKKNKSRKIKKFEKVGVEVVALDPSISVAKAVELYKADPAVEYAEPNFELQALDTLPNDPSFSQLWGLNNTGQTHGSRYNGLVAGTPDADIDTMAAWDITTGSSDVVVAVIDTGIEYSHEDLAANMWKNEIELNGQPGVDDDGNGYVDDIYGIDTVNGDSDPHDDHFHGTHCAGTIGAVGDNGIGVAGVNWNIQLMSCKFLGSAGVGYTADAVECLDYIKDMKDRGVNVVATSNSWGCNSFFCQSYALQEAIRAQMDSDILFITAAGNENEDNDRNYSFPANYDIPNIITVAATDHNDERATFSNWGRRSVHVGAPGVEIYSTMLRDTYGFLSGTSMATPHVAGLAALLKGDNPGRDWIDIKNLILAGGDSIDTMINTTISGKRINAEGSLTCVNESLFSIVQAPAFDPDYQPPYLSALSIQCNNPVGPVAISNCDQVVATMLDDGVAPDQAAGDGIFTTAWTPADSTRLFFSSPAGSETVYGVFDVGFSSITPQTPAEPGLPITIQAIAYGQPCETAPEFRFEVTYPDASTQVICDWQEANTCVWDTTGKSGGEYLLKVKARLNTSGAEVMTSETYQLTVDTPTFSINDVTAAEYGGNNSTAVEQGNAAFTVSLSRSSVDTCTVNYQSSNGTATASLDFEAVSGTLIFNPGERTKTIDVPILDDEVNEDDETFSVMLDSPSGPAVISDDTGTGTIIDDLLDGPIDLVMSDVSFVSGEGTSLTLHNTVENQREENAEGFYVGFYLSVDNIITTDDLFLGHRIINSLAANASNTADTLVWLPYQFVSGVYYIGAIADYRNWVDETDESNNSYTGVSMQVPPPPAVHDPDFHVTVNGRTVTVTVDNMPVDYAKIYVYWGDAKNSYYNSPFATPITHTYKYAGTYDIRVLAYTYNHTQIWYYKEDDPDLGGIVLY
jgi:subtilisin family serine protease